MSEYNIQMNKYNALSNEYDKLYPQPMKHASTHAKNGSDPILLSSIGAYSTSETDTLLAKKSDKSVSFTITLMAAGWSNNVQTIGDSRFVSAGYAYTVAPASGSFTNYAEAIIYADDVTTNGQMVFHCDSKPTGNLTVNIVRMVTAE